MREGPGQLSGGVGEEERCQLSEQMKPRLYDRLSLRV
jgi:hypothetical protein